MITYNLHKDLPCCFVKKSLIQNIEYFIKNNIPQIIGESENNTNSIYISIEDEFGRLHLDSINDYMMDKFSEKTNNIYIKSKYYNESLFDMIIRFTSTGTPCIEITIRGDNPKEKAIAIYYKIKELISEFKTYHSLIHHKTVPVVIGMSIGVSIAVSFVMKFITVNDLAALILITIISIFAIFSEINRIYPKVEFDTNAVIKPKKILHWIVSLLFGLIVMGFLRKKLFG